MDIGDVLSKRRQAPAAEPPGNATGRDVWQIRERLIVVGDPCDTLLRSDHSSILAAFLDERRFRRMHGHAE
jgi:hypothetical protein